jgi:hypothetical protein
MGAQKLIQLAQDLEWLGCELEHYGHLHALEGFPCAGPTWDAFVAKQRGVLTTADKIDRELKTAVHLNTARLVGVDTSLDATLDSVAEIVTAVDEIKQTAVFAVQELPPKVRNFTRMVEGYSDAARPMGS